MKTLSSTFFLSRKLVFCKGAFKYYVIKEVRGWVGQMMMFDDKVGGWEWLNDDVISLIQVTDFFSGKMNQNYYVACSFFFNRNKPCLILALFIKERKKN